MSEKKDSLILELFLSKFHDFISGYHSLSALLQDIGPDNRFRMKLAHQMMALAMQSADLSGTFLQKILPEIQVLQTEDEIIQFIEANISDILKPINMILIDITSQEERDKLIEEYVDPVYDELFSLIAQMNKVEPVVNVLTDNVQLN